MSYGTNCDGELTLDCQLLKLSTGPYPWVQSGLLCERRELQACFQTERAEGSYFSLTVPVAVNNYTTKVADRPVQCRAPCLNTAYKFVEQLVFQALLYVEPMPIGDVLDYYDQSSIFEIKFNSREGDFMLLKKLNCSQVFVSPVAEAVSQLQVVDQGPYGALPATLACPCHIAAIHSESQVLS